jgi:hypothetical protein
MNKRLWVGLVALAAAAPLLAGCGEVRAADPPAAPAKGAPPAPDSAAPAATEAAKDAAGPPGPKPAGGKASPLHFEPTEKTRADFEVSFPTDI